MDELNRLDIEPLAASHLDALAVVLCTDAVYAHLGGVAPSREQFQIGLMRALQGPPAHCAEQVWLNYLVRRRSDAQVLGRLEATVHDGLAEVAFLFGEDHWGHGYAAESLQWLHRTLLDRPDCGALWATTLPSNHRCQALLARSGYYRTSEMPAGGLFSFDQGDYVFRYGKESAAD